MTVQIQVSNDGSQWTEVSGVRVRYDMEVEDSDCALLQVTCTYEGIITDVIDAGGGVLGTSSEMAEEIVERLTGEES